MDIQKALNKSSETSCLTEYYKSIPSSLKNWVEKRKQLILWEIANITTLYLKLCYVFINNWIIF